MLCSKQLNLKDVFPSILGGKIMTNGFTLVNVLFFFFNSLDVGGRQYNGPPKMSTS